jgi:UDP-N-acetylglucosamine 2-epimerase (non-hydrolysing)
MSTVAVDLIAGARPNFVKIASIVRALQARQLGGGALTWRLVHTGQHYDPVMSDSFFTQLDIPAPDVSLGVGSGSQATQTAAIMTQYEALLNASPSRLCLVVGDVNSTLACALTAQKCGLLVAHVEGGLRSGDWSMPEEINRRATDAVSDWFFTTSESAGENLRREGVAAERIEFVGNTMIDTLLQQRAHFCPPSDATLAELPAQGFLVLTLHRPANVDDPMRLHTLLQAVTAGRGRIPVVFPVHPRTQRVLASLGALPEGLLPVSAQPYRQFNWLVERSRAVITDSGGVTEEATVLGVPCLTLRTSTERPETVTMGTNELVGDDLDRLAALLAQLHAGSWKSARIPDRWDGQAGERIVQFLERKLLGTEAASWSWRTVTG